MKHVGMLNGVWVPYFSISDGEPLGEYEFRRRYDEIIQTAVKNGMNAVFVHVRAHCDAAYESEIFPDMDIYKMHETIREYDPLEYMVETAHLRGLEFHAWINPYRIAASRDDIPEGSPAAEFLDTADVIECDSGVFFAPESERARELITAGAVEIVKKYDVDGIHLDDYFYPTAEEDADTEAYEKYRATGGEESFRQWRCTNVNVLIKELHDAVKQVDGKIKFGVSPQGNEENDLEIGADVRAWCGSGWVDYIAPQIYYNSENPVCPFEKTADFWKGIAERSGVEVYIGLALYKVGTDADGGTWNDNNIIEHQKDYAKRINCDGVILYSIDNLPICV